MEDILYKNSVSDIRIREMVTKTGNNDFSLGGLKKIILRSFRGDKEETVVLPLNNQNYQCDFKVGSVELQFNNVNFQLGNNVCPLVIKQDNIYKIYQISTENDDILNLIYTEQKDQDSETNETLIISISDNDEFNSHIPPEVNPNNPGTHT